MTTVKNGYNVSVTANNKILSSDFVSGYNKTDYSIIYLWVTFQNEGVLKIVRTKNGTEYEEILNSGCSLQPNCAYLFPIMITEDAINIKYSVNSTLSYYQMREVY